MEGIAHIKPQIKDVGFNKVGYLNVSFEDGRLLYLPIKFFPSLKKLKVAERKKFQIANSDTIIFLKCNEVYHIQDLLGIYDNYKYKV